MNLSISATTIHLSTETAFYFTKISTVTFGLSVYLMKSTLLLLITGLLFSPFLFAGEPTLTQRVQFKDIDALIGLIEQARDSGLTDEEIKKLQLNLEEGDVSALEYIEAFKRRKQMKDQKLKEFLDTRFLTVGDIFKEMVDMEPKRLETLREELINGN